MPVIIRKYHESFH